MSSATRKKAPKPQSGKALARAPEIKRAQKIVRELEIDQPVVIKTATQYIEVGEQLKAIKGAARDIKAIRAELLNPAQETVEKIKALFAEQLAQLAAAETAHKAEIARYEDAERLKTIAHQARVDAGAERSREKIQGKIEATQQNAAVEVRNLRKEATTAAKSGDSARAALLRGRAKGIELATAAKVSHLEDKAADIVAPIVQREAPKVEGVDTRSHWTFEVTDESKIARKHMTPNLDLMGKLVASLHGDAQAILGDGVRVYSKTIVASEAA